MPSGDGGPGECSAGDPNRDNSNTIVLQAGQTYTLTQPHPPLSFGSFRGPTGLPVLTSKLIIQGNGAIIERSSAPGTPEFRLIQLDSDSSASLQLESRTLRGGVVRSAYFAPACELALPRACPGGGGAIWADNVPLTLVSVIAERNTVLDHVGDPSVQGTGGGGIVASSTRLTITESVIRDNVSAVSGGGMFRRCSSAVAAAQCDV